MVLMPVEQDFSTFFAKFFDWFLVLSQISDSGIYVSTSIEYKFLANIHFSKISIFKCEPFFKSHPPLKNDNGWWPS